ncbi:MAG: sterol desaturase family protein [Deltaproteobacteria bacterium]|nr:sterol desaturase family protein [Deltaproteobacteria bacterium]
MIESQADDVNFRSGGPVAQLARLTLFPLVLGTGLWATATAMAEGFAPAASLGLVSMACMVIVAVAERWIPFRADWNRSHGDILTDILHSLFSSYLCIELVKLGLLMALLPLAGWLSAQYGSPLWPGDWSIWAQLTLVAVIVEFGCYWIHRICHESEFFWRFHAVHHSPLRLYFLNAGRDHPLGAALTTLASLPPAIALGVPEPCMALYFVLQSIHGLFQHANVDVRLGPLNWVFSMAELHRWHHSTKMEEANTNYGLTLICWDIVFGTRFLPHLRGPDVIGIEAMPRFPKSYWGQFTVPFRWRYWLRESAG